MPVHVVSRVERELGNLNAKTVLILGLTYRAGVKEAAFSGTWDLVELIRAKGGHPVVHDPLYSSEELLNLGLVPHNLGEATDAVILHTNHKEYKSLKSLDLFGAIFIVDGRNFLPAEIKSNFKTYVLGNGS
jgi:UDP-N-acetyl-D-mannosaminuronate dehydrogenase